MAVVEQVVGFVVPVRSAAGNGGAFGGEQVELVQVGAVPAGEAVIDGGGQLTKVWRREAAKIRPGRSQ